MISFCGAYLLVLSAVIAPGRFFRRGGKFRACYFAALAMNSGIISCPTARPQYSGRGKFTGYLTYITDNA